MKKFKGVVLIGILGAGIVLAAPAQDKSFLYDSKGKKDPFAPYTGRVEEAKDVEVAGKLSELKALEVQGIIWDAVSPYAIIEDEIFQKGQEFRGARVVEIEPQKVILEYRGERVVLQVKEEEVTPSPEPAPPSKKGIKSRKERGK